MLLAYLFIGFIKSPNVQLTHGKGEVGAPHRDGEQEGLGHRNSLSVWPLEGGL